MHLNTLLLATALMCSAGAATGEEFDRKAILDLLPCKSAALRLCDRSQGIDAAALWRCGATLAGRVHEISPRCINVLRRYGQL